MSLESIRLQIDAISKVYGARRVLRAVSADLASGDTLVVTGRNGAGKSTLLRIIAGLLRPSEGAVHIWLSSRLMVGEDRQRLLGFAGPDVQLYRELTGNEHLRFVARLRGLQTDRQSCTEVLEMVGLAGRGDEPLSGFSSGMLQRLRLGLALMHRPRVLLLDEPTTNLDEAGVAMLGGLVRRAACDNIVIIATNDPRDLEHGELVLDLDEHA